MTSLQTSIDVELQVPFLYQDKSGKETLCKKLTFYRPNFKQARQLAVLIGPQLAKLVLPSLEEDKTPLSNDVLISKLCEALLTHEAMEGIAVLLADMSHESVELINRLDVVDIMAVFKAFFAFFPHTPIFSAGQFGAELALYYHWAPSEINQMDWLDVIAYREELARLKAQEYESHQLG